MAKATTTTTTTRTRKKTVHEAVTKVRVRMYCHGLGDCFLLTYFEKSKAVFQMLIDCGVLLGTTGQTAKMQQVVQHIVDETKTDTNKNGHLNLLVVTHEHWDHVSGFSQAFKLFDKMKIDHVWLGWTEDPSDAVAKSLAEKKKKQTTALMAALAGSPALGVGPSVANLLKFAGIEYGPALAAATEAEESGSKKMKTGEIMDWLREHKTEFCRPGEIKPLGAPGVRAFVLGPPTDLKKLRKDLPTKKGRETYEIDDHAALSLSDQAWISATGLNTDDPDHLDPFQPFDARYRMTLEQAQLTPFFQERYGFRDTDPDVWRQIDLWSAGAADLALKLDSDTNNTSLALAIELPNGKVLLFPGDAQVGNWESWHTYFDDADKEQPVVWKIEDEKTVDAKNLLSRTILYKVGHHGSHNATLREKGLEMMTDPDLVAMIPVDAETAKGQKPPKDGWKMPFAPLFERLGIKTKNRILRADAAKAEKSVWKDFTDRVTIPTGDDEKIGDDNRPLYVDYTIDI